MSKFAVALLAASTLGVSARDELAASIARAAPAHKLQAAAAILAAKPKPEPKPEPEPKPDPKPKPTPNTYLVFSSHGDDSTCGEGNKNEGHGYVIGTCNTGYGDADGFFWKISSVTTTDDALTADYGFYSDATCETFLFSSTFEFPNGCESRGLYYKKFQVTTEKPSFRDGVLATGYSTADACRRHEDAKILSYSWLKNNECDPDGFSFVNMAHDTDESRKCDRKKITVTTYDSEDLSCSGTVTATTEVKGPDWDCVWGVTSGAGYSYLKPECV